MSDHAATTSRFAMTNESYDFLKKLVEIIFPGAGALYFGIAQIWGLPAAEEVVGTIAVICVFLGLVLKVSSKNYTPEAVNNMGAFVINTTEVDRPPYRLELDASLEELESKEVISFKVKSSD